MANELTADTMPTRFDRRHVLVLVPRNVALAGASAILLSLASPAFASQAEFCVRCSGPDQTYRCQVKGVGPQYSDAAKLFCVLTTTKTEGHAKCTATRDPNCQGVVKVYDYGGMPLPGALEKNESVQQYKDRVSREQQKFAKPEEQGRPTLFDLGKGVISGTKSRFGYGSEESAPTSPAAQAPAPAPQAAPPSSVQRGSATAEAPAPENDESFAQRSYRCMKSFFFNCGSEDATN